jgi:hypothetical protein
MGRHGRRAGRTRRHPVRTFSYTYSVDVVGLIGSTVTFAAGYAASFFQSGTPEISHE